MVPDIWGEPDGREFRRKTDRRGTPNRAISFSRAENPGSSRGRKKPGRCRRCISFPARTIRRARPSSLRSRPNYKRRVLDPNDWSPLLTKSFEGPQRLGAYLRSTEWRTATAADRKLFQAPFRAGIRLDSYQLLPLAKALELPRVNLLIADDVGLGKTVEAGLIVRELLLRRRIDMIVVAAPASMLLQWQDELAQKFGLDFTIVDREHLLDTRRTRGFSANPWSVGSRFIVSHSVLSDETYMGGLRDLLSPFRPGSMLILDEAHHAAPSSGTVWALESQMTRSVREIAALFEHRLFLSATPHNGHSNSFATLLEILDPQRFTRGIDVEAKELEPVMVRRLKEDLRRLGHAVPGAHRRAHPHRRIAAGRARIATWPPCSTTTANPRPAAPGRASCSPTFSSGCSPRSRLSTEL